MSHLPDQGVTLIAGDEEGRRHLDLAQRYLAAVAGGATGEQLAAFFTEDAVQEEFPNRLIPAGAIRDRNAVLEAAERGKAVVASQTIVVHKGIAVGGEVALELTWSARLAVPVGKLARGDEMRARFAIFLAIRDGRIARQHNYDCFEPF